MTPHDAALRKRCEVLWGALQAQSSTDTHQIRLLMAFAQEVRAAEARTCMAAIEIRARQYAEKNITETENESNNRKSQAWMMLQAAAECARRAKELEQP